MFKEISSINSKIQIANSEMFYFIITNEIGSDSSSSDSNNPDNVPD